MSLGYDFLVRPGFVCCCPSESCPMWADVALYFRKEEHDGGWEVSERVEGNVWQCLVEWDVEVK